MIANFYVNLNTAGVHELAPAEAGKRIGVRSFCLTTQDRKSVV